MPRCWLLCRHMEQFFLWGTTDLNRQENKKKCNLRLLCRVMTKYITEPRFPVLWSMIKYLCIVGQGVKIKWALSVVRVYSVVFVNVCLHHRCFNENWQYLKMKKKVFWSFKASNLIWTDNTDLQERKKKTFWCLNVT